MDQRPGQLVQELVVEKLQGQQRRDQMDFQLELEPVPAVGLPTERLVEQQAPMLAAGNL
jgi:hypothetical protein